MRRTLPFLLVAGGVLVVAAVVWLLGRDDPAPFRTREVLPGAVYSGGQPSAADLERAFTSLGVRTVINLRGRRVNEDFYQEELAACSSLGLVHEDVRVKTDDWPPQHEVRRFVVLLEELERPLLLHCKSGVDRSGWAGAVARCLAGEPLARALELLSPRAGHVCIPGRCPLHRFFALYEGWLERQGTTHSGVTFRRWALDDYCPQPYDANLTWEEPLAGGALFAGEPATFSVRVTNRSEEAWRLSPRADRGIRLGVRALGPFQDLPGNPLGILRTPNNPARDLARAGVQEGQIQPGESRVLVARFPAPFEPGRYVFQIDMVDEQVHWFSDLGGAGILIPLEVKPR